MSAQQITRFDEARAAGMTAVQAARWVAYLDMKAERGEGVLTLDQAVRQLERAHDEKRMDRVLRELFEGAAERLRAEGLQVQS
jgi:hypothetical protein